MLHKEIWIGTDYPSTAKNFRDRQTLVQQVEERILRLDNWDLQWPVETTPFVYAVELLTEHRLIDIKTFRSMIKKPKSKPNENLQMSENQSFKEKLLDGMDSVILVYLNELAMRSPDHLVILYTADRRLYDVFPRVRSLFKAWYSQNTAAVFAYYPNIYCKKCYHPNPSDILSRNDMTCENDKKFRHPIKL